MSLDNWGSVVSQLKDMNCTRISLAGGEPLMAKNFFEILDMINLHIAPPAILTNGTLLNEAFIDKVFGKVQNFQISLDSLNPVIHDSIRGVSGSWKRATEGIKNAIAARIPTGVRITIFEDNINEAIPLMNWAHEIGATSFLARRVVSSGAGVNVKKVSPDRLKDVFRSLILRGLELRMPVGFGDPFPQLLLSPKRKKEADEEPGLLDGSVIGGCSVSIDSMYITQDGTVLLCPYLPIDCGNVKKDKVKDIWINAPAYKLARSIRSNLTGKCGLCKYKFACGGCRANAYYETGDICGEDSGCWL